MGPWYKSNWWITFSIINFILNLFIIFIALILLPITQIMQGVVYTPFREVQDIAGGG